MKYHLILLLLTLNIAGVKANYENDSLISIIANTTGNDRINALNQLSRNYTILAKTDSALKLAIKALKESEKINYEIGLAESYISICFFSYYNDFDKLKEYTGYLLKRSKAIKYATGIAYAYIFLSDIVADSSTIEAVKYLMLAEKAIEDNKESLDLAIVYSRTGDLFLDNSDYNTALRYCIKSINIFDNYLTVNSSTYYLYNYAELCNFLGIIYKNLNDYGNSRKYYKKHLEISQRIGEMWGVAIAYNNLGTLARYSQQFDLALDYFTKSMDIWRKLKIDNYRGDLYMNVGNIYLEKLNYENAENYLDSSYKFFSNKNSLTGLSKVISCQANLYLCKHQFQKAIKKFKESLKLNEENGNLQVITENYKGLANTYDSIGDFKNAFYYFKLYTQKKDSLFSIDKTTEVGQITANYEIRSKIEEQKRQDEHRAILEKENLNRRNSIQYSGITIFVVIIFTFVFFSGKLKISDTWLEVLVFVSLLLLFEFIQVIFDPFINRITGSEPFYLLLVNLLIVGVIIPIDALLEKQMNKRIKKRNISSHIILGD